MKNTTSLPRAMWLLFVLLSFPSLASGQTADNVLLVINQNSQPSIEVGTYYAQARGIAPDHIVQLDAPVPETITRQEFERTIEAPIGAWLQQHQLQDRILYLVLTKGIPLRVAGTAGIDATTASVDSELTLLYKRLLGMTPPVLGRVPNPYYLGAAPISEAKHFTRFNGETYLVTRLDGFTTEDVQRLIDRGLKPSTEGRIVLDQRTGGVDVGGDEWLRQARTRLVEAGSADRVILETTKDVATTSEPVMGYYAWGSNDPANQGRRSGLTFSPGAIGGLFVSTDGRTLTEPPADWQPSGARGGRLFAGTNQSLTGDLIRDGITGVSANVNEPLLDGTTRPQILFPAYLSGFNLAESFYLATPFLSWQTIVIGDPLCAPYAKQPLAASDLAGGIDPETGLPALFSARRVALLGANLTLASRRMMVKLLADIRDGVTETTEPQLVRIAELEPKFVLAHTMLAAFYASRGRFDDAADRYRRALLVDPDNVANLNDLAWLLAVHKGQPREALPLAEKALRLSVQPDVLDTVGWIRHLQGDDDGGVLYVERAIAAAPTRTIFLIHAAEMQTRLNRKAAARNYLAAALKLDPTLADRSDVKTLQAELE